jgi:hypothetical protein
VNDDELISDGCIRIAFVNGTSFAMRTKGSGVIVDDKERPVFPEFAIELTVHRSRELLNAECVGTA